MRVVAAVAELEVLLEVAGQVAEALGHLVARRLRQAQPTQVAVVVAVGLLALQLMARVVQAAPV